MIPRLWLVLVGVPAVATALVLFTATVSTTPSTLGGGETPTVAATTPTTSAGTPTTAAATSTPAAAATTVAGTPTTAAGLPSTGIADDGANANANILWLLGLALAAVTIGGLLLVSSRRR
jgi:hypothetical protein